MNPLNFFKRKYLFSPVDNTNLIIFRWIYGFLITAESWGAIITGWVKETFVDPAFTFNFIGFDFLQVFVGPGMYAYYILMGALGIMVMIGWKYHFAASAFAVMWTITYLLQKSHYNNHYYLLVLLSVLMALLPANRYFSIDAQLNPKMKSLTCPGWVYVVIILQVWIVYTFAGFSKIYDDWIDGIPIRLWFAQKEHYWLIGGVLQQEWLQSMVVWGGIFFDILVIPALLWKRTRIPALGLSFFFHLFNSAVFQVGIFPYLALGFCLFFFDPETIRSRFFKRKPKPSPDELGTLRYRLSHDLPIYLVAAFFIVQLLLPVRYHLYKGNVHWTEEGHRMAWKMMLRSKAGYIRFKVINKDTDESKAINPLDYVSSYQYRRLATMPDLVWQFTQFLKKELAKEGWHHVEIYAISNCSLNGSPFQPLIKPDYDLARAEWHIFTSSDWIAEFHDKKETSR